MSQRKVVEHEKGKVETVVKLTAIAFQIKPTQTVAWVGGVGIGKSAVAERLAMTLKLNFVPLYALRLEPTDLLGIPYRSDDPELKVPVTEYALPKDLLHAVKTPTLLFWDEFDKGTEDVRRAALEILNWGKLSHNLRLHEKSCNLIALNPPECGGRYTLTEDIVNRVLFLHFPIDVDGFVDGLMDGSLDPLITQSSLTPLPQDLVPIVNHDLYVSEARKWQFIVANFIKRNETALFTFPTDWEQEPFGTPRSWVKLTRVLGGIDATDLSENEKLQLRRMAAKGLVGEASSEFLAWLNLQDLPTPDEILSNPAKLPKRLDALALTLANLASFVQRKPEAWLSAWDVAVYLDQVMELEDMAVNYALLLKQVGHQLKLDFTAVKRKLQKTNIPTVWLLGR